MNPAGRQDLREMLVSDDGGKIPAVPILYPRDFLEDERHRRLWLQFVLRTPQPWPAGGFYGDEQSRWKKQEDT